MSEPQKFDMFDVAKGNCKLEDFLLTRFSPQELEKKIQVDPQAGLTEHIAPPKPPAPPKPLFPVAPVAAAPAAAPEPVDFHKLIAGFHQAAQDYTKRANWDEPPVDPPE